MIREVSFFNEESCWLEAKNIAFHSAPLKYGAFIAQQSDERLYRMIKGFCEVAQHLVEQSETDPILRRNFVYPVVYLYRQSIELRLKYFLIEYGPLVDEAPNFRSHDLESLWLRCKRVVKQFDGTAELVDEEAFKAAERTITEFNTIDPRSDAFRFAHNTQGKAIKVRVGAIDLSNLSRVVASLHNFLECVDWQLRYGAEINCAELIETM